MNFLAPAFLALASLAVIVLALHVQRRRTLTVPSLQLWRQLQSADMASQQVFKWPRPSVLLFLQLAAVAAVALALAQPLFGVARAPEHWIFLVDGSASMQVRDEQGTSRFETALARIAEMSEAAGADNLARISLVSAGVTPTVTIARQPYAASLLEGPLSQFHAGDGAADWTGVADIVGGLYRQGESARLIFLSDGPVPGALQAALPAELPVDTVSLGRFVPNASLRAEVAPVDPAAGKWTVSGDVTMTGGATQANVTIQFTAENAEAPLDWASLTVGNPPPEPIAGQDPATLKPVTRKFEREIELPGPGVLTVHIEDDAAAFDNAAHFVLQAEPTAFEVLYVGAKDQPAVRALQAIDGVSVFEAEGLPADIARFDLVIVDDVEVARRPETNTLWIGRARVSGEAEPQAITAVDPANWRHDHSLAKDINWASLGIASGYAIPRWPDGEVLIESGTNPLIQVRTGQFGREIGLAFDPAQSNWPQQSSFPGFIAQLVHWVGATPGSIIAPGCTVGVPCILDARLLGDGLNVASISPALSPEIGVRMAVDLAAIRSEPFIPEHAGVFRLDRNGHRQWLAVNTAPGAEILQDGSEESATGPETSPWATRLWPLAAGLLLVLLLAEAVIAGRGPERFLTRAGLSRRNPLAGRRYWLLGLRLATLVFVVAAVFNAPMPVWTNSENVVLGISTPHSPQEETGQPLLARSATEAAAASGDQRIGVVDLGSPLRIEQDLGDATGESPADTAIAGGNRALLLAAAMLPQDQPGRIVIEQDRERLGSDFAAALPTLQSRGIAVDYIASPAAEGDTLVQALEAPASVYAGDSFPLTGIIYSPKSTSVEIEVLKDGEVLISHTADLQPGHNRVEVPIAEVEQGRWLYEMTVSAEGDAIAQNNRNGVIVNAHEAGQIAIVSPHPEQARAFAQALADQGLSATVMAPSRAPFDLKGWLAYREIVLMNVPAIDLITAQQNLIETAVFEHGRGLVIIGGDNSFGPGGYLETPLDRLSPLSSKVPREAPEVALAFVLDRSGSMQQPVNTVTRLDIAKQATASAIGLLNAQSQVSVTVFDSEAQTILPMQMVPSPERMTQVLAGLDPGGGTAIYPGLVQAFEQLRNVEASAKHVIVMTDGLSQRGDFLGIVAQMRAAGITVSGVAIGSGALRTTVEEIALAGGGAFHTTTDIQALPSILSQEAMMLSGAPIETGTSQPQWVDRSDPFLSALPSLMPPIEGFVLTTAKPEAKVALTAPDAKGEPMPLLAHWRFGNGHVMALTTDAAGDWTRAWQGLDSYPLFWAQALRQFLPGNPAPGLNLSATRRGDELLVALNALAPDGAPMNDLDIEATVEASADSTGVTPRRLELVETAPGFYQGRVLAQAAGNYTITAAAGEDTAEMVMHVAYPARFDIGPTGTAAAQLAAATGGRPIGPDDALFSGGQPRWSAVPGWQVWLLTALALFMADLFLRYGRPMAWLRRLTGADKARKGGDTPPMPASPAVNAARSVKFETV